MSPSPAAGAEPHPNIRVERTGQTTTVTIDQPAARNACSDEMWQVIGATFGALASSGTRVIVLTGAGGDFCAGADLSGEGTDTIRPGLFLQRMRILGHVVQAVHDCPVPVIAKVDGVCVGAGLGLALAADMIWCSDRARFSAIFSKRGLSLDCGTSWLLRQRIGVHRAKELALTGRIVGAKEALSLGLVNTVVPVAILDVAVRDVVQAIAAGPPIALSIIKRQLDHASHVSLAQAVEAEALAQSVNSQTNDMREAFAAFFERRDPDFMGS
jgi:2-(1,2-epoxy-1,2-dihydrophenyl)acetyl-CoA isomerase